MQFNDEMDICPRCMVLFLAPKDNAEQLLASEDAVRGALPRLASAAGLHDTGSWRCLHAPAAAAAAANTAASVCPVCFDVLAGDGLQRLTDAAVDAVLARSFHEQRRPVYVNVVVPPAVDLARLTARLLVTRTAERTFSFPPLFQVVQRLVGLLLGRDQRLAAAPLRVVDDAERLRKRMGTAGYEDKVPADVRGANAEALEALDKQAAVIAALQAQYEAWLAPAAAAAGVDSTT